MTRTYTRATATKKRKSGKKKRSPTFKNPEVDEQGEEVYDWPVVPGGAHEVIEVPKTESEKTDSEKAEEHAEVDPRVDKIVIIDPNEEGEKPCEKFQCRGNFPHQGEPTCDTIFARRPDAARHVLSVHLGRRDFKCRCGKRVAQAQSMVAHLNSVAKKRPFKCGAVAKYKCQCGQKFMEESATVAHLNQYAKEAPVRYADVRQPGQAVEGHAVVEIVCTRAFGDSSSLDRHKREQHGPGFYCRHPDCKVVKKRRRSSDDGVADETGSALFTKRQSSFRAHLNDVHNLPANLVLKCVKQKSYDPACDTPTTLPKLLPPIIIGPAHDPSPSNIMFDLAMQNPVPIQAMPGNAASNLADPSHIDALNFPGFAPIYTPSNDGASTPGLTFSSASPSPSAPDASSAAYGLDDGPPPSYRSLENCIAMPTPCYQAPVIKTDDMPDPLYPPFALDQYNSGYYIDAERYGSGYSVDADVGSSLMLSGMDFCDPASATILEPPACTEAYPLDMSGFYGLDPTLAQAQYGAHAMQVPASEPDFSELFNYSLEPLAGYESFGQLSSAWGMPSPQQFPNHVGHSQATPAVPISHPQGGVREPYVFYSRTCGGRPSYSY
ncbi:hypothetical protein BD413DRAFT_612949 [Trametes elegans]|nr:hypothetical protein BD413DRAFT_612949 [Trametes elegans]